VIRAVIDTNVLVSALISPSGNEALTVLAIQQGLIKPYFSAEILQEYAEVLARPKFRFPPDEIQALIDLVRSRGEAVSRLQQLLSSPSPDPSDEKFLICARTAQVDYIVTGNKRDFPPQSCEGFRVVNARELLRVIVFEI
jgi:uncharacterized protein